MIKTMTETPSDLSIPVFLQRKFVKGGIRKGELNIIVAGDGLGKSKYIMTHELPAPEEKPETVVKDHGPTVQDYIREKAGAIIAELEGMIDDEIIVPGWSLYEFARGQDWTAIISKKVSDHFQPTLDELILAKSGDDADVTEGYRSYTGKELSALIGMYQDLINDADRYTTNFKPTRKPKKRKAKSAEKLLKNFVYLKSAPEFKLFSIEPAAILKAMELWTFNPTNKVLTVYRAIDRGGLGIKRTSITNFDEQTTVAKKIGRKTAERLEIVLTGGKVARRDLMDSFIGEKLPITRITKNHISS